LAGVLLFLGNYMQYLVDIFVWVILYKYAMWRDIMNQRLITTANNLEGYQITEHLGIVRGITVRSRSVIGNLVGSLQSVFGGNISVYSELCEQARQEAFDIMIQHAEELQADAIIAMRYDANEIGPTITEVLCYGTAVKIERL
jgi:uncharacterized protein YbjQ (UPF0145 family)